MGSAAKKDWLDRALDSVEANPEGLSAALAMLTPKVPVFYPPINPESREALPVSVEPIEARVPVTEWGPDQTFLRTIILAHLAGREPEKGDPADAQSALRHHLLNANDWGAPDRITVLALVDGMPRRFVVEGTEAALWNALPDHDTLKAWKEAGVAEFPIQLWPSLGAGQDAVHSSRRRAVWVPINQVPVVLQMEREWRSVMEPNEDA